MSDEFDETQGWADEDAGDEVVPGADADEADAESTAEVEAPDGKSETRINDLMSKWQKAEDRNRKLEERLAALEKGASPTDASQVAQYVQMMQEQARDQVFRSDPRFARYQLETSLIEGTTPDQMRRSAERLGAILDAIETDAQNAALKKHGLSPEVRGGEAERVPDFGKMSDEQFDAYLAKVRG